MRESNGRWAIQDLPCPTPVLAYNKHMGGVDLSDQLIQYYTVHRKAGKWYRTVFLHLVDIATTNAYILHKELSTAHQVQALTHKDFMVELVCQLIGRDKSGAPTKRTTIHAPVPIDTPSDPGQKAPKRRLRCQNCLDKEQQRRDTVWKCQCCDMPLCVTTNRNCFTEWHK
ncbi:unnamed protein product [Ophioblennius macclurei]